MTVDLQPLTSDLLLCCRCGYDASAGVSAAYYFIILKTFRTLSYGQAEKRKPRERQEEITAEKNSLKF